MKVFMIVLFFTLIAVIGIPLSAFTAVGLHRFAYCIHEHGLQEKPEVISACTVGEE